MNDNARIVGTLAIVFIGRQGYFLHQIAERHLLSQDRWFAGGLGLGSALAGALGGVLDGGHRLLAGSGSRALGRVLRAWGRACRAGHGLQALHGVGHGHILEAGVRYGRLGLRRRGRGPLWGPRWRRGAPREHCHRSSAAPASALQQDVARLFGGRHGRGSRRGLEGRRSGRRRRRGARSLSGGRRRRRGLDRVDERCRRGQHQCVSPLSKFGFLVGACVRNRQFEAGLQHGSRAGHWHRGRSAGRVGCRPGRRARQRASSCTRWPGFWR